MSNSYKFLFYNRVKVHVEDRESSGGYIYMSVHPSETIDSLKNKVSLFEFIDIIEMVM